jgi:hypothetical protein
MRRERWLHGRVCGSSVTAISTHACPAGRQQQRQALYDATAAAQARLAAAQRAHAAVTRDLAEAGLAQERVHAAVEAARARQQRLASALAADAAWLGARPHATALLALEAGPLTPQVR